MCFFGCVKQILLCISFRTVVFCVFRQVVYEAQDFDQGAVYLVPTQPGQRGSGHSYKLYYCTGGRVKKRPKTCVRAMYTAPKCAGMYFIWTLCYIQNERVLYIKSG